MYISPHPSPGDYSSTLRATKRCICFPFLPQEIIPLHYVPPKDVYVSPSFPRRLFLYTTCRQKMYMFPLPSPGDYSSTLRAAKRCICFPFLPQEIIPLHYVPPKDVYLSGEITLPCATYSCCLLVAGTQYNTEPVDVRHYTFEVDLYIEGKTWHWLIAWMQGARTSSTNILQNEKFMIGEDLFGKIGKLKTFANICYH